MPDAAQNHVVSIAPGGGTMTGAIVRRAGQRVAGDGTWEQVTYDPIASDPLKSSPMIPRPQGIAHPGGGVSL
jgi:hypothetical protein